MRKYFFPFFSLLLLTMFCVSSFAQPDTLSTAWEDGADVFISNDDKGDGDMNYSELPYLVVRKHEVRTRIAYLKFNVEDNPLFGAGANDVTLGLNVKYAGKMATGETELEMAIYGMTDDSEDEWVDTLLTYNTAPGMKDADLNEYKLDDNMVVYLTDIIIPADETGWVYSELSDEMDEFVGQTNQNEYLTFIVLVDLANENTGDEVRFFSAEQAGDTLAPRLLAGEPKTVAINNILSNEVQINQNFPNPFSGSTVLSYTLNHSDNVQIEVYNTVGAKLTTLVNEFQAAGEYTIEVDMDKMNLPAGTYYAKFSMGSEIHTIKMINTK